MHPYNYVPMKLYINNKFLDNTENWKLYCNLWCLANLLSGEWRSPVVAGNPPPPLYGFSFTHTDEGRVLLFGGYSSDSKVHSTDVYYFDIATSVSDLLSSVSEIYDQVHVF